jgi:LPPG:FO 2-phospho-L-lactate transferase
MPSAVSRLTERGAVLLRRPVGCASVRVVALAGGIGAGKFLRGLLRVVPPKDVTVVVNTADDIELHGLHVSPDLDSIVYWLGAVMDRDRGWGRRDDSFRATGELRRFGAEGSWFGLGDLDLATHLFRTGLLRSGASLSEATARVAAGFGLACRVLPMSDGPVTTRIEAVSMGRHLDLHFQEYWVQRQGADEVKAVRYAGADEARPAPGVLEAISAADAVVFPPSNPVASIGPILAVPGVREAVAAKRSSAAGVSGIVGGAPLAGMADRLLPATGVEVSAAGVAGLYRDLLSGWVIDRADEALRSRIEEFGLRVAVTDTVMTGDVAAEHVARTALSLLP